MTYPEALETLERCRYCLMCRHADPLGHVSFNEALTPHGIALSIYSEHKGLISWTEHGLSNIFSELDAGVARAHCATDQMFSEAVAAVKAELASQGKLPLSLEHLKNRLERDPSLFGHEAVINSSGQSDYALFISDEVQYLWPESSAAVKTLVNVLAISPVRVAQGQSSGLLAVSMGFLAKAKEQAKILIAELETSKAKELIVLGNADLYAFKQLYSERLGLSWTHHLKIVSLLDLFLNALREGKINLKLSADSRPYAYIDPSQALRVKNFDTPRQLLKAVLPGKALELFWRRERSHPTGSGGIQFINPKLAEKLSRARLEDAQKQGAEVIYCEEAADLAALKRYASDYGLELIGLYELLAQNLG